MGNTINLNEVINTSNTGTLSVEEVPNTAQLNESEDGDWLTPANACGLSPDECESCQ